MSEFWKPIPGYETKYEISNLGNIRSITRIVPCKGGTRKMNGKVLKQQVNRNGYRIIALSQRSASPKTYAVHQLMGMAFIPGFVKGTEINHIDGNPQNNSLGNLEVSNPSHNQFHAVTTGLRRKLNSSQYRYVYYINNPRAKSRWAACITHNGKASYGWKTFTTEEAAAKHADLLLDSIQDTQRTRNFP